MLNIRVVSLDHYISKPINELYVNEDQSSVKEWQEPVLRIFGPTADGLKCCAHVHGVYPYIYVPYKGGENGDRDSLLLGAALDEALKSSLKIRALRFVHKVTLISGIPLYGYHSKHRQFFKIYFYNPFHVKKAAELLLSGAILGQKFQPHEAHIPYTLQFMMDYNIYGMSFVTFSKVKYRRDTENSDSLMGVKEEDILSSKVKKTTWCQLEVDTLASDILNRIGTKNLEVNPGLQAIWENEEDRRRAQNRKSQITVQHTQSRSEVQIFPTEAMYQARLRKKLSEIVLEEPGTSVISSDPVLSYPAEVPENVDFLEASAIEEDMEHPQIREPFSDSRTLIDEKILTQMSESQNKKAESESEEETEFDSVLGRNQRTEEGAEHEEGDDGEGVDMTQPFDSEEEIICGPERNRDEQRDSSSLGREAAFWKSMADKIFQLDGAQESSSESETETPPSDSTPDLPLDFPSSWSGNIMSILSECPSTACQTPRGFWSDYSPDWLSQNQDAWIWNKNGTFSDFSGKTQSENLDSTGFCSGSKESLSGEPYNDGNLTFLGSNFPASCLSLSNVSPSSAVLTPGSEVNGSDINLDSIYENLELSSKEKRKTLEATDENKEEKLLQMLKSFSGRKVPLDDTRGHLTLKQYIKDCKEIVSVDFKNLCNREMIIIEYKSQNQRSLRNKYLIKPLDKFLENWNSAEKKANCQKDENIRSNYVINVLEKRYADTSTFQTVKSMEIHPENENKKERCYNVNENVISHGKIKMKLIKSRENVEKNKSRRLKMRKRKELIKDFPEKRKNLSEPDTKLINEINSSFEEYFKNIVKRKNFCRKKKKEVEEEKEEESSEDENPTEHHHDVSDRSSADPINFVTRFLSTFSKMPDVPPLSITIRLGTSIPVQVSLRPSATSPEIIKKHKRRTKIENVDGAADGSSSEDSTSGETKRRPHALKKSRRESYYKPLNMVVYGSEKDVGRKRKAPGNGSSVVEEEEEETQKRKSKKRFVSNPSRDLFGGCREKPKSWPSRGGKKKKSSSRTLVKDEKDLQESKFLPGIKPRSSETVQELDFIDDSDEERKWKELKKGKKSPKLTKARKIMQAYTESFTSSDDGKVKGSRGKRARSESLPPVMKDEKPTKSEGNKEKRYESENERELEPRGLSEQNTLEPETSCSVHNVTMTTAETLSQFTLSGSPLLASKKDSESSSPAVVLSQKKPSQGGIFNSSDSSEKLFGSSNSDLKCSPFPEVSHEVTGSRTIRPKEKPLNREEVVKSLERYELIENEANAPFYGDPKDVTKAVEAGPRILKIENRSVAGLKAFKSSLDITGSEERRDSKSRSRLVGNRIVTITPLIKPPSRNDVLKRSENERKFETGKTKIKIVKPLSPGQEGEPGEEEEVEMSVTMSFSGDAPETFSEEEGELNLKKGPLSKIKGIKRFLHLKKLSVPEEQKVYGGPSEESKGSKDNSFQIRGITLENSFGFRNSVEDLKKAKLNDTYQHMSMLVMELHFQTRKDLLPDPNHDPIRALFYAITFNSPKKDKETGIMVVGDGLLSGTAVSGHSVLYVPTEKALFEKFLVLVRQWDPEILAGYEIEMHSWGYLVQRGFVFELNLLLLLGRVQTEDFTKNDTPDLKDDVDDIPKNVKHMKISGRIVLEVWRVLRHEIALTSYTFENVMYHLTHERHPLLSYEKLSHYWEHPTSRFRHLVVEHYVTRVLGLIKILDELDFIDRTSELSRLFGIQFYEVLSRGSQYRVESMMLRLAKPLNYVPASPSVAQRAAMRAPASLPLILEPESLFYSDPVIVLDFQSLYPSIIIAYNYCFSTCLGRIENLGGREPFEFGCTQLQISPEELKKLENDLSISPAGVAFVRANVRKGILPTMLEKILETRLMVKKSIKENKENKILQKVLCARQLGLKLIANVTYGYTAANFSGRMPCIEVGDSVVSKGRETLHRAIQLVKNTRKWGARVVYGDTDSIFILTPGRTRQEAFKIGAEIAEAVTLDNPKPVKLKLEKVYQPSILQTKKRYVGYMYETPDQEKPTFEAKGIETVRRDGCPATGKILEKALQILFETKDVSLVKKYTVRQFAKLYQGRVNIQDLIFAKEYRGRRGYRPGACVPALHLAKLWTQYDKRAEPRVKERVPYVIVNGPPGVPLIRLVRSPKDLISDPTLRINAVYYITKAIVPPMQRCFSLLGADVGSWYSEMPKIYHKMYKISCREGQKRSTISQYFAALECVICSEITSSLLCSKCEKNPQETVIILKEKIRRWERCHDGLSEICRSCCGRATEIECVSLDCPVLFRKNQARRDVEQREALHDILTRFL